MLAALTQLAVAAQSFAQPRRYMQGKQPERFYKEELWPKVDEHLEKLEVGFSRGYEIFKAFIAIDLDNSDNVDMDEIFKYFGGGRTAMQERFFWLPSDDNDPTSAAKAMNFLEFALTSYKHLSLSVKQLARMVFEIYDPDGNGYLERCDLLSMFMWTYDVHEVSSNDIYYIDRFPFDEKLFIEKEAFIDHCAHHYFLLQPVIDFQRRLRRKMGGVAMWESISAYRSNKFRVFDEESLTLEAAHVAIVMSEDPFKRRRQMAAERLLQEKEKKMADEQAAQERLLEEKKEKKRREKQLALTGPDRFMRQAWKDFEDAREVFHNEIFSTDQLTERRETRLRLYELLDTASRLQAEYFAETEKREEMLTLGTDADHKARYKEWLKTRDGKVLQRRSVLQEFYKIVLEDAKEDRAKKKMTNRHKTKDELYAISGIDEIERDIDKLARIKAGDNDLKRIYKLRTWEEDIQEARRMSKKGQMDLALERADKLLCDILKEETIKGMYSMLSSKTQERERDLKRKEFDLASSFGSRHTRFELVWDRDNDRDVYVDFHTLRVLHRKTAICEMCDDCFEQSDLRCKACGAPRSSANMKLYRPLGFKDIRID